MTKMKKDKTNIETLLSTALMNIFGPLVAVLDYNVGKGEADAGMQTPSMKDMGIRIILGQFLQTVHNQTFGSIPTSNGTSIDNAETRMKKSEQIVADIISKRRQDQGESEAFTLSDLNLTNNELQALHWFDVNAERLNANKALLEGLGRVYTEITGEVWAPYVKKEPVKVDAKESARLLALLEKAKAKNVREAAVG